MADRPYHRVLVKVSGEALAGPAGPVDAQAVGRLIDELLPVHQAGVQIGLVLGAVYEYTESLAVPALAHGLWNSGIFLVNYYVATTAATMPG